MKHRNQTNRLIRPNFKSTKGGLNRGVLLYIYQFFMLLAKTVKTRCVCETQMPLKRPFFEKCNLYIWPWPWYQQMHIDEIWLHTKYEPCKYISLGIMGKCSVFTLSLYRQTDRRTDKRTDRQTTVKQYSPDISLQEHNYLEWLVSKFRLVHVIFTALFECTHYEKSNRP